MQNLFFAKKYQTYMFLRRIFLTPNKETEVYIVIDNNWLLV